MPFYRRSTQPPPPDLPRQQSLVNKLFIPVSLGIIALLLIIGVGTTFYIYYDSVPKPNPGVLVSEDPQKIELPDTNSFQVNGFSITPIAGYTIRARVLEVAYYSSDTLSAISPADFFLGWGDMSDSELLDQLHINLSDRSYGWRYYHQLPVSKDYIYQHSCLSYILPATPEVARTVMRVRKNNIVFISGYLVNIKTPDNVSINNQRSKNAPIILWVEKIDIEQ